MKKAVNRQLFALSDCNNRYCGDNRLNHTESENDLSV